MECTVQKLDQTNIIGYKLTDEDYSCQGYKYKIGETYVLDGKLEFCQNGFHFCEKFDECYDHYNNIHGNCHLLKVKAVGTVLTNGYLSCTDKIEIIEEITDIEGLIEENKDNVNWKLITYRQKLSEDFIEKYQDRFDWDFISRFQRLSEDFIEKHSDKLNSFDWDLIIRSQKLSEDFIERNIDRMSWDLISTYQKLSEDFVERHMGNHTGKNPPKWWYK